jgi:F420-non-reducing hydrogenase small subunit
MSKKPKIAAYCAAGCGGCDIAILEIQERILDLVDATDVVFWPTAMDFKYDDVAAMADGEITACFFNGAIRTEENAEIARLLRAKSQLLVAFGACASFGGVPGLANLYSKDDMMARVFSTESTDAEAVPPADSGDDALPHVPAMLPSVGALSSVVDVDYVMPGCPPEAFQVWAVCEALLTGQLPEPGSIVGAGDRSVCDECSRPKRNVRVERFVRTHQLIPEPDWCLLEQGLVCMGPATRSGCNGRCPSVAMPCRGCYGAAGDTVDQGAKMVALLGSMIDSEDESVIASAAAQIADPAGTFYSFTLPTSLLGGARVRKTEAEMDR